MFVGHVLHAPIPLHKAQWQSGIEREALPPSSASRSMSGCHIGKGLALRCIGVLSQGTVAWRFSRHTVVIFLV